MQEIRASFRKNNWQRKAKPLRTAPGLKYLRRITAAFVRRHSNCYDFVNHLILALLLQAIGIPIGPIISMLLMIRFMRYYLRTGFGESKKYMGGTLAPRRMHGLTKAASLLLYVGRFSALSWWLFSMMKVLLPPLCLQYLVSS